MFRAVLLLVSLLGSAFAINFDWENIQLTEAETKNFSAIRFWSPNSPPIPQPECKYIPGEPEWPSDAAWDRFNETLGGTLLKPLPPAVVCYNGPLYNAARCEQLKREWAPMSMDIQNSGHDFNGKSVGGHSLSVWVHNLRGYVYHPTYISSSSNYSGQAVACAGGFNTGDSAAVQARHRITILSAGAPAVGLAGGFLQAGGHSNYASYYGMAADHVLSIQAVVASGEFVTADAHQNSDLFWAFGGGGGGTYGIITSVVVKAFPMTPVTSGTITFDTLPSLGRNISTETFWEAMKAHWRFVPEIVNAGGLGWNFIYHRKRGNLTGLEFITQIHF